MALPTAPLAQEIDLTRARILIHGAGGAGKSTLLSGWFPQSTFVMDFDDAWRLLPGQHFRETPNSFAKVMQLTTELLTTQHPFKTVVVDTVTRMHRLADLEAGSRYGKNAAAVVEYGRGTADRDGTIMRCIAPLFAAPLGVVLLAHSGGKDGTPEDDKRMYPAVDKRIYDDLVGGVDFVFAADRTPDGRHVLVTGASDRFYTKSRWPMPAYLELPADPREGALLLHKTLTDAAAASAGELTTTNTKEQ